MDGEINLYDEINSVYSLFLDKIGEPEDNQLLIKVKESSISKQASDIIIDGKNIGPARIVSAEGRGHLFKIFFSSYATYLISTESFVTPDNTSAYSGRLFKVFYESRYLDFIRQSNIIEFVFDQKLIHYQLICENHIIDILSVDEPVLEIIS